jgi:hypothetical protein
MTKSKAKKANEPTTVVANDPEDRKDALKMIGGSHSDHWNNTLANQAVQALWVKNSDATDRDRQLSTAVAGLAGIGLKDELEGMMAAQLIAAHNAAMECYRRAMIGEQTFEGRRENLNQAGEQAVPHLGDVARRAEQASRQGPAEGDGRACPCSRGRPGGGRDHRATGGWESDQNGGTTPCKADCPCT